MTKEQFANILRAREQTLKYQELLVFIIQTLDHEFNSKVQSTDNPIGLIRSKVDRLLNHN